MSRLTYRTVRVAYWFPGLVISVVVFASNLFGDSLRDWLDPKQDLTGDGTL